MDADERAARAASFGAVAQLYADHRPGYPDDAVAWLVGTSPGRLLELGAGTGKLTRSLLAVGHDVVASDPSSAMLDQLRISSPRAHRVVGSAEEIALPPGSVDVVVAAQAFHWFDLSRALPEIARVLRPGGVLAIVWNTADQRVPWVKKVFGLIGLGDADVGKDPVGDSELFATSDRKTVRHWQKFDREALLGFCSSQSLFATKTDAERRAILDEVGAIYDSYGRGHDGMLLPWNTYCYRARVSGLSRDGRIGPPGAEGPTDEDDLDDGLLVDFR
jgi:SAM-dependent methyltransferase